MLPPCYLGEDSFMRLGKKILLVGLLTMALGPLVIAVRAATVILEEIIAKVNGDIIARSAYQDAMAEARAQVAANRDVTDQDRPALLAKAEKDTLRNLIDELLLVQKGDQLEVNIEAQVLRQRDRIMEQNDLKTTEEFEDWAIKRFDLPIEDLMDQLRRNLMSQAVLGQEVGSRIVVAQEEVEQYYNEHKTEFVRKESVRLSEIFVSTEGKKAAELEEAKKKANEVHDRVHSGELFAEMARRFSENKQSAEQGGALGSFERGSLRKELEEIVFDANPGFITELIEVPNGYLLLKVDERFRAGQAELEEAQEEIRDRLMGPKWDPAVREYLTTLREEAYIEIRPGYLDEAAVAGKDTSWSDPADLAPVTTTKEELLKKKKKRRLLWLIPLPGGGGDKDKDGDAKDAEAKDDASSS